MPYQAKLHYDIPHWRETEQGRMIDSVSQGVLNNPYANLYELQRHLLALARSADEQELQEFASCGDLTLESHGSEYSRYSLFLLQMTPGPEKPGWFDFDAGAYTELLQEPLLQACFDGQSYRHLDFYLTGLVELRLLKHSQAAQDMLQALWSKEGLLDFYWDTFPMRRILAQAYQMLPWQWFCPQYEDDILAFRGALLAALSYWDTYKESIDEAQRLKLEQDLLAMQDLFVTVAGEGLSEQPLIIELRDAFAAAIQDLRPSE